MRGSLSPLGGGGEGVNKYHWLETLFCRWGRLLARRGDFVSIQSLPIFETMSTQFISGGDFVSKRNCPRVLKAPSPRIRINVSPSFPRGSFEVESLKGDCVSKRKDPAPRPKNLLVV